MSMPINQTRWQAFKPLPLSSKQSQEKIHRLSRLVFPLTEPTTDQQGNTIQLWSIPESSIAASIQKPDGSISYISSQKIKNPLNPEENTVTLHNRLLTGIRKAWDYAFTQNGDLVIWPRLIASSWQEAIPKPNGDITGIARLARGRTQGEMCAWFFSNGYGVDKAQGTQIDVHLDGQYAGSFHPEQQQEALRNFLRSQRGPSVSFTLRFTEMGAEEAKNEFSGRGIVFRHSKDHYGTTFNIDCTTTDGSTREKQGGHHIDVRSTFLKRKEKISTKESYVENRQARLSGKTPPYRVLPTAAALLRFRQLVQQTGLIKSYNSSHADNPMPEKGMAGGDIGGVASQASYIENLFDGPEAPFIDHHYFCFPALPGGEQPFTELELKQIIRELASGIYEHGALPFFSLHFQEAGTDLFPVIHPAYANTLVGRVIGMLDYIMKGYLNGGVYQEEFIDSWHERPNWETKGQSAFEQLIEFTRYCKDNMQEGDQRYISLAMMKTFSQDGDDTPEELREFTGFKNAFRIISRIDKIEKEGVFLHIGSDFDVFYDINPTPAYKEALEEYVRKEGKLPKAYQRMEEFYKFTASRIHEHMQKMPLCQKYVSMLSVISFFSSYFSTLKAHRKQPCLSIAKKIEARGCPPLFPHLPVIEEREITVKLQTKNVWQTLLGTHRAVLEKALNTSFSRIAPIIPFWTSDPREGQEETMQVFTRVIFEDIWESAGALGRRVIIGGKEELQKYADILAKRFLQEFLDGWQSIILAQQRVLSSRPFLPQGEYYTIMTIHPLKNHLISRYLGFLEGQPEHSIDLLSSQYIGPVFPNERKAEELKKSNEVVGGCSLKMKAQKTEPSLAVKAVWQRQRRELISLEPETWHPLLQESMGIPLGWAFRLFFADLPAGVEEDFSWMGELLTDSFDEGLEQFFDLQRAIETREKEAFLEKLQSMPDTLLERRDNKRRTLLHHALLQKEPFYIEHLVQRGFSLEAQDENGYLPLHYAAMHSGEELLRIVYRRHLLNAEGLKKDRPLSVAILHKNKQAVRFFLSKRAELAFIIGGYTDLHSALHEGDKEIINLLLGSESIDSCLNVNSIEGGTPLMLACELGDLVLVQTLVDKGADPAIARQDGVTALEIALRKDALEMVSYLIAISTPSFLALQAAAQEGTALAIEMLGDHLYRFQNASQDNAIHLSLLHGNSEAALTLIRTCPEELLSAQNIDEHTPLHLAAGLGDWEVIEALLERGVQIQNADLEHLLKAPYHPLLKEILKKLPLSQRRLDELVLLAAKAGNYRAISEGLALMGANLDSCEGPKGWKLVHYLAKSDGIFLFRKLIERGQDLYQPLEQEGNLTLAGIAAKSGSRRILQYLLKRGASIEQAQETRSLLLLAIEGGVEDIVLESQGQSALRDREEALRQAREQLQMQPEITLPQDAWQEAKVEEALEALKRVDEQGAKDAIACLSAEFVLGRLLKELASYREIFWLENLLMTVFKENSWDLNQCDEWGKTPLFYACLFDYKRLTPLLIEKGADVSYRDRDFLTPLAMACVSGSFKNVQTLLQNGADPNQLVKAEKMTAICLAAAQEHVPIICHLLSQGANPAISDKFGTSPIHLLAQKGCDRLIRLFLIRGASVYQENGEGKDSRYFAAAAGQTKTLAKLISWQEEPLNNEDGLTLLNLASRNGHEETVRWLLAQGVKPLEEEQLSPLAVAATCQNPSALLPLFEPYSVSESAAFFNKGILAALQFDKVAAVKRLYASAEKEINLDITNGYTGIHLASKFGAIHSTQWLLSQGASPSLQNSNGETALELAAANTSWQQFRSLLEYEQPSLDKTYLRGETLMHIAARSGNAMHLALLIAENAPIDPCDYQRCTPLYRAAEAGQEEVCKLLLAAGANPNLFSASGKRPFDVLPKEKKDLKELFETVAELTEEESSLHRAIRAKSLFALQFFLNTLEPIALCQRDKDGKTALTLARETQHSEMIDALLSAGAEE